MIIGSEAARDIFARANAGRLEYLAGGLLGLQAIGLLAAVMRWPLGGDINGFDITVRPSLGGIAMVLLLFILARVFRRGAIMRDDLEGTI